MLSIKKIVGKKEKEITCEGVYNKLEFICEAVTRIFQHPDYDPPIPDAAVCGLQNIFWDALTELDEIMDACPSYGTFKEYEELDEDDKRSVRIFIRKIKDRKKAEQETTMQ